MHLQKKQWRLKNRVPETMPRLSSSSFSLTHQPNYSFPSLSSSIPFINPISHLPFPFLHSAKCLLPIPPSSSTASDSLTLESMATLLPVPNPLLKISPSPSTLVIVAFLSDPMALVSQSSPNSTLIISSFRGFSLFNSFQFSFPSQGRPRS